MTLFIGRAFRRRVACFLGTQVIFCLEFITLEVVLLYYRQSECVWYLQYMKVLVIQLDGHPASQTHPSGCQHLTLFLQWPMWKIFLQTAVQIVGRQQVVINPLSTVHKGLWISSFICKINKNSTFFWFTFMTCFTFSIYRNSSGPPSSIAKKRLLIHWPFPSDGKKKRDVNSADRIELFSLLILFFSEGFISRCEDGPESCDKSSAMRPVHVMKTYISQNWSAVLICKAASFPTALKTNILKVPEWLRTLILWTFKET